MLNKGIALPIVIIFIALFLATPIGFYYYTIKRQQDNSINIKGSMSEIPAKTGVTVRLSSKGGTWDLHQFLCDDRDACLKSLTIGKSWGIVSGGITNLHEFNISPDEKWGPEFKYLKIYAKSSWGSMLRLFTPFILNEGDEVEITTITTDGVTYNVVLIPLENITSASKILLEFKDY